MPDPYAPVPAPYSGLTIVMFGVILGCIMSLLLFHRDTMPRANEVIARAEAKQVYEQASVWRAEHDGTFEGFRHPDAVVADRGQTIEIRYEGQDGPMCFTEHVDFGLNAKATCTLFGRAGRAPATG